MTKKHYYQTENFDAYYSSWLKMSTLLVWFETGEGIQKQY